MSDIHFRDPRRPKILIVKLGHLGDVLLTTPVASALRRQWPSAYLAYVVNQGTEAMALNNPDIDKVFVVPRKASNNLRLAAAQFNLLLKILACGFDLVLDLSGGDRGALVAFFSRAGLRMGFAPKKPHIRARAFNFLIDGRGTQNHVVETNLRFITKLKLNPVEVSLKWRPGDDASGRADELLRQYGLSKGSYVLLHPTSRWMFKTWTVQGNARLLEHISSLGMTTVMTCAPDAKEMNFCAQIKAALPPSVKIVDLSGKLTLSLLGALIERARLFVGVDSVPMHMAAALKVPTIALFGPSGEKMWGPWQVRHRVLTMSDCPHRPCGRDGCDGSKISKCLENLPAQMVTDAVDEMLASCA